MKCKSFDEIMERFHQKQFLSKFAAGRLPADIASYMQYLAGNELSCDCRFESDDGKYLYTGRDDADDFVLIATSGQGDEWLLRFSDGEIHFLDHDNWDEPESISSMKISFQQFVVLADLLGQFETEEAFTENDIELLEKQLCLIHHSLVNRFPFNFI